MKTKLRFALVALMSLATAGHAWAIKLGTPVPLMKAGERVSIDVPVELASGEQIVQAGIAPEQVYGTLGISFPPSLRAATVTVKNGQLLHIAGGVPKGSAVPVVMDVQTNIGQSVRQFTVPIPGAEKHAAEAEGSHAAGSDAPKTAAAKAQGRDRISDADFANRMAELNLSISRVAEGVQEISQEFKRDNSARDKQLAVLQAAFTAQQAKADSAWGEDAITGVLAGVIGFSVAVAWLIGSRPKLSAGAKVQLIGAGCQPIEGEFVQLTTPSHGKHYLYKLADMVSGAPKMIEVRVSAVHHEVESGHVETPVAETAGMLHAQGAAPVRVLRPAHARAHPATAVSA